MVTGFRRSELCVLRWNNLDVVNGVLAVARSIAQLDGETWEKDTNTHQYRRIAGSPHALKPATVSQRYSRLAHRIGIKTTLHKLRHYSATELIAGGVEFNRPQR